MRNAKRCALVLLIIIAIVHGALIAQDNGLVIRSPLYGSSTKDLVGTTIQIQSYAEQLGLAATSTIPTGDERLLNAISEPSYPVTPGDTYRVIYLDGLKTVTLDLQVNEAYQVVLPGLGRVNGQGLTFQQMSQKITDLIEAYHSYSNPQVIFTGVGSFYVSVIGEVTGSRTVQAWGLTRLSQVVGAATPYTSTRTITITHADGSRNTYDLYLALRKGVLTEDPLLKSGDVVSLGRAERLVHIDGHVYRTGSYQLQEGENLSSLITDYAGGVLSGGDIQRIRIQRFDEELNDWTILYADLLKDQQFEVRHLDKVYVDLLGPMPQSILIEGAISSTEAANTLSSSSLTGYVSGRIFYQLYPGETIKHVFETLSGRLLSISDLERAYILRDGQRINLDLQRILYGQDPNSTRTLENGDAIMIPFSQRFVSVTGGVVRSGMYAYAPNKSSSYYIALAGGYSDDASFPLSVKVQGEDGRKIAKTEEEVPPSSTIIVKKNTFTKDIAPTVAIVGLVAAILGIVSTTLSIIKDVRSL
ncbi:MAG TPA: SLBB domain-containing protein [Sphaerochaeta sp.]|nr:SLBB domain-containing protein [Spirochaetota bacterium]HOE88852.1 SLBB domain-containing protein [Sphaerochaeta sp.]HOR80048.1 SLBB domain-containing protein [Sphaerochaeta sp.]